MLPLTYENVYDLLHEGVLNDVNFYKEQLEAETKCLEIGCGTGRVTLPLLKAGINVSGLDISNKMLSIFREKLKQNAIEKCDLYEADMKSFQIPETYTSIFIPFNTFLFLESFEEQSSCLKSINAHLEPEGKLIIDIVNPLTILQNRSEGALYNDLSKISPERSSLVSLYDCFYFEDNFFIWNQFIEEISEKGVSKFLRRMKLRFLSETEMTALLKMHGFTIQTIYGSYTKEAVSKKSGNMIFVVKKNNS